jgi:hypothetical protein
VDPGRCQKRGEEGKGCGQEETRAQISESAVGREHSSVIASRNHFYLAIFGRSVDISSKGRTFSSLEACPTADIVDQDFVQVYEKGA